MRRYDTIPSSRPDRPFPVGDIERNLKAEEWLASMEEEDWEDFISDTEEVYEYNHPPTHIERVNHNLADELVAQWDDNYDDDCHQTATGYVIASRFVSETELLPPNNAEIRMALIRMKHENTASQFARSAWRGMAYSHPRVFMYHEQILHYAERESDLEIIKNTDRFIAGLVLPYMMSQTASLARQAEQSRFTSMTDEKLDLSTTDFGEYFTTKTPLVSHRRDRRGIISKTKDN